VYEQLFVWRTEDALSFFVGLRDVLEAPRRP